MKRPTLAVACRLALVVLAISACSAGTTAETVASTSTTTTPPTTIAAASTTPPTTTPPTTAVPGEDYQERIEDALYATLSEPFNYQIEVLNMARWGASTLISGLQDPESEYAVETWTASGATAGVYATEDWQLFGRALMVTEDRNPVRQTDDWSWLLVDPDLEDVLPVSLPAPRFRYADALINLIDEAKSVTAGGAAALSTHEGLVNLERYDVLVDATYALPFVGDGAESAWLVNHAPPPGFDAIVEVNIDEDGMLRVIEISSEDLGQFYRDQFEIHAEGRDQRRLQIRIEIRSIGELRSPAFLSEFPEASGLLWTEGYLSGEARLQIGHCFTAAPEMGWPSFADSAPCDFALTPVVLATIAADLGEEYPGYSTLDTYATSECFAEAERQLGKEAMEELHIEVLHFRPGPRAWELGDRSVYCGVKDPAW